MQQCIPGEEDMIRLGMFLGTFLKGEEIIYLRGELGAGKPHWFAVFYGD